MVETAATVLAEAAGKIRTHYPASEPEMVADVVRAVLITMSGDLSAQETSLLTEVEALGKTIAAQRPRSPRCGWTTSPRHTFLSRPTNWMRSSIIPQRRPTPS